jgi:hypothetical protein
MNFKLKDALYLGHQMEHLIKLEMDLKIKILSYLIYKGDHLSRLYK